jgi:hypothetical protein
MNTNFKFPTDTCVLVCSGPSLNLVDPFSLGLPVVVISTAIRKISNPHYWILADYLNEMHGNEGNIAYQNENILKIVPAGKISPKHKQLCRNFTEIPYADADRNIADIDSHLFSGKLPLLKGPHKSVTFGIQWLHHVGVKNVIWVGNDLNANSAIEKYAYESTSTDLRKSHNYNVTLDQVHRSLKHWYPTALKLGYKWESWKCGEVFEQFVPKFNEDSYEYPENNVFSQGSALSEHAVVETTLNKVVPNRVSKEERRKLRDFRTKNVLSLEDKKKLNRKRILDQAEKKINQLEVRQATKISPPPKVESTPKTPVSNKKYPKYVSIPKNKTSIENSIKKIKDSLR